MKLRNHYLEEFIFEPLRVYLSFFVQIVLFVTVLRAYEWFQYSRPLLINANHWLQAVSSDLIFALQLSAAFLPLFGFFHFLSFASGRLYKIIVGIALGLVLAALSQYYVTATVPLGVDFWGYSYQDIKTTVLASSGMDWRDALLFAGLFLLPFSIEFSIGKWYSKNKWLPGFLFIGMILSIVLQPWIQLERKSFDAEDQYLAIENKGRYFASKSIAMFIKNLAQKDEETNVVDQNFNQKFPFERSTAQPDVLDDYLNKSDTLPNLVFVFVEGLGKSFTGPNAMYGGFTPFLDSLAGSGLQWDNFISSAGRTFGVLPSVLGSLPLATDGFMSLKQDMPNHTSMIRLLKTAGYESSYFYGGNANFDYQDIFLEAQGIDQLVSEESFPSSYVKMKPNSGGFSWGYPDKEVFRRALELKVKSKATQHLDIFMTLTTHEPFVVPEDKYKAEFLKYESKSPAPTPIKKEFRNIFECLLYTDDAIRSLIAGYKKLPGFERTIFVITGDHRMIPVPHSSSIDRYHVPFIIWSPLIKKPMRFKGVASHHQVMMTFMTHLNKQYEVPLPEKLPMLGGVMSTSTSFESSLNQGIMRNKGDLSNYVSNTYFLSDGAVFEMEDGLSLSKMNNGELETAMAKKLDDFRSANERVCKDNAWMSAAKTWVYKGAYQLDSNETSLMVKFGIEKLSVDDQFFKARDLAFAGKYKESRAILKHILNGSPNYSDVRILLGRTYSWEGKYAQARQELKEAIKRSPNYYDGYLALIDCELYNNQLDSAKYWLQRGLELADDTTQFKPKKTAIYDALRSKK
ncbi:MAG TPA: sulfatase-like hydrolase/transferase [Luteibaculaceae bacterium]|nr:sulfatase-like hydrolase/transferase [Luteibaculaceae bacterium]